MNVHLVAKSDRAVYCWGITVIVSYFLFIVVFVVVFVKQLPVLVCLKIYLGVYSDFDGVSVILFNILYNVLYELGNL